MAKGDNSAPIPGLARFLADANGEVKDLSKSIKDLERDIKRAGTATKDQLATLDELYTRRDALTRSLKSDRDLKRVEADVKFLRALAVGQGVRALLSGKLDASTFAQLALQPSFLEGVGKGLQRAGKIQALSGTVAGRGLQGVGSAIGRVGVPALIVSEVANIVIDRIQGYLAGSEAASRAEGATADVARATGVGGDIREDLFRLARNAELRRRGNKLSAIPGATDQFEIDQAAAKVVIAQLRELAKDRAFLESLPARELREMLTGILTGDESASERRRILNEQLAYDPALSESIRRRREAQEESRRRKQEEQDRMTPDQLFWKSEQRHVQDLAWQMRRPVKLAAWVPEKYTD